MSGVECILTHLPKAATPSPITRPCTRPASYPQIPTQIFITDELPKTATGKIQRRFMVDAFINKPKDGASA